MTMTTQTQAQNGMLGIEVATKRYAAERENLAAIVDRVQQDLEGIRKEALPGIKRAVAKTAAARAELAGLIEGAPELFEKPRTVVFYGVKVGLQKGKGLIEFEDEERVIRLIRSKLPERAESLVGSESFVRKGLLKELSVAELKLIGCTVEETADQVVIRAVDGEVEKVVQTLLAEKAEN